ncbi:hypothetical protein QZH41_012494, partial [Actinostola sp. cb2023]
VFKEVIKERQFTDRAYNEALEYEIPFLALASVSLVACITIPLTGLIFFCCRCFGQCGGQLEEEDMNFSPVKQRQRLSVSIALCSVLILIGSSCIFLSSDRLGASIPILNTVFQDSIDDIIAYKNNTIQIVELMMMMTTMMTMMMTMMMTTTMMMIMTMMMMDDDDDDDANDDDDDDDDDDYDDAKGISAHVAEPVMVAARKLVRPILESIGDYGKTITVVANILDNVNETVNELQELGRTLRYRLNETRQNLTEVRKSCKADPGASAAGICDKIPAGDQLTPVADFSKVPDVSTELKKVKRIISIDIALEARKGNESFEKIPGDIANTTHSGRQDIINTIRDLEKTLETMVSSLKDTSDQFKEGN